MLVGRRLLLVSPAIEADFDTTQWFNNLREPVPLTLFPNV